MIVDLWPCLQKYYVLIKIKQEGKFDVWNFKIELEYVIISVPQWQTNMHRAKKKHPHFSRARVGVNLHPNRWRRAKNSPQFFSSSRGRWQAPRKPKKVPGTIFGRPKNQKKVKTYPLFFGTLNTGVICTTNWMLGLRIHEHSTLRIPKIRPHRRSCILALYTCIWSCSIFPQTSSNPTVSKSTVLQ